MALITPEERALRTADLLRSLEDSIRDLRHMAEDLKARIEAGEEADLVAGSRQLEGLSRLIRSCQNVEERFVEQHRKQAGLGDGGYALDLERARVEIGGRLDRLRAARDSGEVSG